MSCKALAHCYNLNAWYTCTQTHTDTDTHTHTHTHLNHEFVFGVGGLYDSGLNEVANTAMKVCVNTLLSRVNTTLHKYIYVYVLHVHYTCTCIYVNNVYTCTCTCTWMPHYDKAGNLAAFALSHDVRTSLFLTFSPEIYTYITGRHSLSKCAVFEHIQ